MSSAVSPAARTPLPSRSDLRRLLPRQPETLRRLARAQRGRDSSPPQDASVSWLKWLLPYLTRRRSVLLLAVLPAIGWVGAMVVAPLIQRAVVDDALVAHTKPLLPWLGLLVAAGLTRAAMSTIWRSAGGRLGLHVLTDIRDDFYSHLQHLDQAAHERMNSGALVARVNSDLLLIQQAANLVPSVIATVLQVVLAITIMWVLSPILAALLIVVLAVLVVAARSMHMRVYAASWDAQQAEAEMTTVAEEAVTGVRVVKGFGQEQAELDRFIGSLGAMFRARVRAIRQRAPLLSTLQAGPLTGQVIVLAVGGMLALGGHLTIGTFFAFLAYLADLTGSAKMLAMVMVLAPRARSGTERVAEVFAVKAEVTDPGYTADAPDLVAGPAAATSPEVRFEDVHFSYPEGQEVLKGFDLTVAPGETVALVGATGSGKSTALQLVNRLRDSSSGRVTIDGVDVRDIPLVELRDRMSLVFDEAMLSSGTIWENVTTGKPEATQAEVDAVTRTANIHEFIQGLDDGYETVVGEQGLTLSGGQRQRLALARALLSRADVLVLDDATSAVDVAVERQILAAMRDDVADKTVLVVAYRESTVELADRVVLVDDGRVVGTGTHSELMARSSLYRGLLSESPDDVGQDEEPSGLTPQAWKRSAAHHGRARVGDPITPRLAAAVAALKPATDHTGVDAEAESTRTDRFRLRQLVKPQRWGVLLGVTLLLVDAFAGLSGPLLMQNGLEHSVGTGSVRLLALTCLVFVVVAVLDFVAVWACHFVTSRTTERVLYALRVRMFAHLQRLGMDFYDRTHAGRIMTRLTSDVNAVAELVQTGLTNALVAVTTFTGMTVVLLVLNAKLAMIVLAVVPFAVVSTILYRRVVGPSYEKARELNSALNTFLHETLAVLPVTHAFGREHANQDHFRDLAGQQLTVRRRAVKATALYIGFIEGMAALTVAGTLLVGSTLIAKGQLQIADLLPFLLYLALAFAPVQQLAAVFDVYQRASTGLRRISGMLAEEASVVTPEHPTDLHDHLDGSIELSSATLQYQGTTSPALRSVDLRIEPGERIAFVGQTGAGKSTIAKVITRFYDVTGGQVAVDGVPLTELDASEFRHQIGYVPQEPFLFSRSIRDNIAYGYGDVTDEEVEAAARAVGAHDFIAELDGGYLHEVTERGKSLSAGQRQLLCMARALVLDPSVLVLDEATSHLDLASERRVEVAMRRAATGRTTIVIAHRPQTLRWVDRVVTVHAGEIVEDRPRVAPPVLPAAA